MNVELKELANKQAAVCHLFANPKRILILWTLVEGEKSVGEIADALGSSLQNTSQHLTLMRNQHILQARREAQTIFYSIFAKEVFPCRCLLKADRPPRELV